MWTAIEPWLRHAIAFVGTHEGVKQVVMFLKSDQGLAALLVAIGVLLLLLVSWRRGPPVRIRDHFATLSALKDDLRRRGFEGCELVVGIDLSKSNVTQGKHSYGGRSLHSCQERNGKPVQTPYELALRAIYEALVDFVDDDGSVPLFGFGDATTKDTGVFALNGDELRPGVAGIDKAVELYYKTLGTHMLSGPTSLAPIIERTTALAVDARCFHLLLIITDGDILDKQRTIEAVAAASRHDVAIVVIGVGDGPFDTLETLDDNVPTREFDNCQFVNLETLRAEHRAGSERFDEFFARNALMELGEQWSWTRQRKGAAPP